MRMNEFILVATVGILVSVSPLLGKEHGHGHGHDDEDGDKTEEKQHEHKAGKKFEISAKERELIRGYCEEHKTGKHKHHGLPPGLAKKVEHGGSLPPGWQEKVVVGEKMPVTVYKEALPLPKEVVVKLPPPPIGTITVAIDGKVVRLLEATKEIMDVFDVHMP